ncbi:MAG TPA: DinB family protein [Bryobacteraceae bacterium]|nr:DinB family protein [Bryobacteraceae bacterium]
MRTFLIAFFMPAAVVLAQDDPLSTWNKGAYRVVQQILLRSAEKMPEEQYSFRPTDSVRSFGQLVGHVADAQYMFCSIVLGEKNPAPGIEKAKTAKADLIPALKEAFAYCDRAYKGMTDQAGTERVKLFGEETPKLSVLTVNQMHNMEHYGNLVTYLRMKNIVPPTSEPGFMEKPKK